MKSLTRVAACGMLAVALPGQDQKPPYFDEPTFIVAGVTDSANRGGHGSDPVLRSAEALAKATASLSSAPAANGTVRSLREAITREPNNAALHHSLGDAEEKLGSPVEALREYQRAAELEPSESYIFDLGDELLTHGAAEQAVEVFTRGARLFPRSSRMLLGLAVACYSKSAYDQAREHFFAAADLNPADPTPYLFLGKVQSGAISQSDGFAERMERFVKLHPENAWANYYCAISIWKRSEDTTTVARAQSLLETAVRLDPQLGAGWLELGVLHADRREDAQAIAAWQRAIAASPRMEQAHYRLAQAYLRMGEPAKAKREMELFEQLSKASAAELDRERAAVKQFVFER
jgi:tetratricopeptide (TPR) repeat protein